MYNPTPLAAASANYCGAGRKRFALDATLATLLRHPRPAEVETAVADTRKALRAARAVETAAWEAMQAAKRL